MATSRLTCESDPDEQSPVMGDGAVTSAQTCRSETLQTRAPIVGRRLVRKPAVAEMLVVILDNVC